VTSDVADGKARPKALLLIAHEPTQDPRIDWFSEGLAADFAVCELGIHRPGVAPPAPRLERLSSRRTRVRIDGRRIRWDFVLPLRAEQAGGSVGRSAMERLFLLSQLPARALEPVLGAAAGDDLANFLWLLDYFVRINSSLLRASRQIGGFDVVVAADLDTLPAAVALAEEYGVPLVYDAHEYWPHAFAAFSPSEIAFWSNLEKTLIEHVTLALTVSPQLAEIMSQRYGCAFDCIPNCAPLGAEQRIDLESALARRAQSEDVIFLVQGVFGRQRGFEKLINVWDRVDPRAKLWLRGPESPEKASMIELAKSKRVFNRGVWFPDAVPEAELVRAAREADVGVVPYEPVSLNNRFCSPNKLSQYMAAGLPIVCNELDFVKSVVLDNGVGAAVDFGDEDALMRTINEFVLNRNSIPALSRKSQAAFKSSFNWQARSQKTYSSIRSVVANKRPNSAEFDFDWKEEPDPAPDSRINTDLSAQERLTAIYTEEIQRLGRVYAADLARIVARPLVGRMSYIVRRATRVSAAFLRKKPAAVAAYRKLRGWTRALKAWPER
jgi:glycosyltransferase involved in cell wall biosynthesis